MFAKPPFNISICANVARSGRSAVSQDCDNMAVSNLVDGVDWYSLSSFKPKSSAKIPISKGSSVSSLAYLGGDNAIVIGGLSGLAYVIDCATFNVRQELRHNGAYILHPLLCG
jgi:hypothetical protein